MLDKFIPWFLRRWNWWINKSSVDTWEKPLVTNQDPLQIWVEKETIGKPVEQASSEVLEKVDKLITSSNLDKVRYFLKKLFRKELWVEICLK